MAKYTVEKIMKKKWVMWCDRCGHGFKVDADNPEEITTTNEVKPTLLQRLKLKKMETKTSKEIIKPEPLSCPVCGKTDEVTVIKLQECVVESITRNSD